jgi:toxin-antitoxin system PIN domain toxin
MGKTLLPDINFWLALVFDTHLHHPAAKSWFDQLTDEVCSFCRVTQYGFLRLANNPKLFPTDAMSLTAAWQLDDTTLADARVAFADEPANLESGWRQHAHGSAFAPKLWGDAYLAAFAEAGAFEVVTFDTGFRKYRNLACTILP